MIRSIFLLKIIPCERRTYVVEAFTSTIRIWRFCAWIFFFPLKCSSSSDDRVCVSYIALKRSNSDIHPTNLSVEISGRFHPQNTILSTISRIFLEFLILYDWFHQSFGKRSNIKIWENARTISHIELV